MKRDRGDRALDQPRIHREGHVGGGDEFVHRRRDDEGQALAAIVGIAGKADPAAVGEGLVGVLETFRRGDAAVLVTGAAFPVADPVERQQHLLGEATAFGQHRRDQVGRRLGEAGEVGVAGEAEHVVHDEQGAVDRRLVDGHEILPMGLRLAPED